MKRIKLEDLIAGLAFAGILLLFGAFMFCNESRIAIAFAVVLAVAGIVTAVLLRTPKTIRISFGGITSFVLCVAMVGSLVSPAFAATPVPGYTEKGTGRTLVTYLRDELALSVETYGLTPEMTDDDLAGVYLALDTGDSEYAWNYANQLLKDSHGLSEAEVKVLLAEENTKLCLRFYDVMEQIVNSVPSLASMTGTSTPYDTLTASGGSKFTWNVSKNEIEVTDITPESYTQDCTTKYRSQTDTLTLTTTAEATLSISVDITGVASVKINDTAVTTSWESNLSANGTVVISITSGVNEGDTATVRLNYAYGIAGGSVTLQFMPVNQIPYKVNGTAVTDNAVEITGDPADGFVVAANDTHYILTSATLVDAEENSTNLTVTGGKLSPEVGGTITPKFEYDQDADGIAPFLVGSTKYWDWDSAKTAAQSASPKRFVLNDDYTLEGRTAAYEIPAGVTFLVPYDDANTLCTTKPTIVTSRPTPSVYRMLTMPSGAHITVCGALSVSGQQYASRPIGAVSGKYGAIEMAEGSSITVAEKGNLYAWGYIAGVTDSNKKVSEGTITIQYGGTVYEDFQGVDWRGGSATSSMLDNSQKVFPLSQYYVQNVQVPMTLESGANENTFTSVKLSIGGTQEVPVNFIGSKGMFVLGENSAVIKDYDEATDRLILKIVKGSVSLGSILLELKLTGVEILGTPQIKSENYVLPLNNNITIIVTENTSISAANDVALLPGAKIILEEGSTCNIDGGNFYIYDLDQWSYDPATIPAITASNGKNGGYCSEFNYLMMEAPYVHDRIYTRTVSDLKDAEIVVDGDIIVDSDAYIYCTAGGANIQSTGTGTIQFKGNPGTNTVSYQAVATEDDRTGVEYKSIDITSAVLTNGDGSTVTTAGTVAGTTYYYANGRWISDQDRFNIITSNLVIKDSLDMYFYVDYSTFEAIKDSYKAIVKKHYDENFESDRGYTELEITISGEDWKPYNADDDEEYEYYRFCFPGIAAKEMTDKLEAVLAINHDKAPSVSDVYEMTVQKYAITMLSRSDTGDELRFALMDMLEYGAAAQTHFGYSEGSMANANPADSTVITDNVSYISTVNPADNTKMDYDALAGVTISATNRLMYTFYFALDNVEGLYAEVTYRHKGNPVATTYTVYGTDFYKRNDTLYGVDVPQMYLVDGFETIRCELYNDNGTPDNRDDDGEPIGFGQDSVAAYATRNAHRSDLYMAMMRFVQSAINYFY